jgi:hypothetical protein
MPAVNFYGSRPGVGLPLLNLCANGAGSSKSFRSFGAEQTNNQYLESYDNQCQYKRRSKLLAEMVERADKILETRPGLRLRGGATVRAWRGAFIGAKSHGVKFAGE